MKRVVVALIAIFSIFGEVSAQMISSLPDHSGVKFGVRGSFALSKMTDNVSESETLIANISSFSLNRRSLPAFAAGVALDIPVLESFHFNIGLQYIMKGQKSNATATLLTESAKLASFTRIGYLELPVQPQFRLNFNNSHLNCDFGPYFALGLHGHNKVMLITDDSKESYKRLLYSGALIEKKDGDKNWKKSSDKYKSPISRFDMGLALNISYEVEFFHIGFGYEIGLRDINKNGKDLKDLAEAAGTKYTPLKNKTFLATIGVNF